jgi:hypothetical protein
MEPEQLSATKREVLNLSTCRSGGSRNPGDFELEP